MAQILVECPLPTAFSLVSSSPVDGRSKLSISLQQKSKVPGDKCWCWLGYLSWKGKRRGKWGLKEIPCESMYHFPGKDSIVLFLDIFLKKPNKTQTMKPVTSGISCAPI